MRCITEFTPEIFNFVPTTWALNTPEFVPTPPTKCLLGHESHISTMSYTNNIHHHTSPWICCINSSVTKENRNELKCWSLVQRHLDLKVLWDCSHCSYPNLGSIIYVLHHPNVKALVHFWPPDIYIGLPSRLYLISFVFSKLVDTICKSRHHSLYFSTSQLIRWMVSE